MRKINLYFACIIAISGCLISCHSSSKQAIDSTTEDSMVSDSIAIGSASNTGLEVDSIIFSKKQSSTITCRICIDFPRGDGNLDNAVKSAIAQQLASCYLPQVNGDDNEKKAYPVYKGDPTEGKKMVDYYGNGIIRYLKSSQEEQMSYMDEPTEKPSLCDEISIRKGAETGKYLTYDFTEYCDLGGAHGSFKSYSINIDKRTSKLITRAIDTRKMKSMQSILRKGVMQYLKECDESVNNDNLNSYLTLDGNTIPLPEHSPWVENDSISFVYQQYEIAPYAMGLISFKLPIKEVAPFLTKEMKAMLKD